CDTRWPFNSTVNSSGPMTGITLCCPMLVIREFHSAFPQGLLSNGWSRPVLGMALADESSPPASPGGGIAESFMWGQNAVSSDQEEVGKSVRSTPFSRPLVLLTVYRGMCSTESIC